MSVFADQVFLLARRSVVRTIRQPANVIFPLAAPRIDSDTVRSAAEADDEGTLLADDDRTLFTARIATRTPITGTGPLDLLVHNESLHFFDPESGAAIRSRGGVSA